MKINCDKHKRNSETDLNCSGFFLDIGFNAFEKQRGLHYGHIYGCG